MLELDKRQLRKGKAYGIGYIGSKRKVAKRIYGVFSQNYDIENKVFYDIFGGGGAVSAEFAYHGHKVVYNDLDKNITESFKNVLYSEKEDLKKYAISRSEFMALQPKRKEKNLNPHEYLKLLTCSFGNNQSSYIYPAVTHEERYNNDLKALSSLTWETDISDYSNGKKHNLHNQLKQLYRTSQLPNKELIKFKNKDFKTFSNIKNAVIYLDPPYQNTGNYYISEINYNDFYNFAVKLSKNNIVLTSSYEITDPRFEIAYSFDKLGSTLSASGNYSTSKNEKIYKVKEEYLND